MHLRGHLHGVEGHFLHGRWELGYAVKWPLEGAETNTRRDLLAVPDDDDPLIALANDLLAHHVRVHLTADLEKRVSQEDR